MSRVTRDSRPADVLVACYAALDGWGGGLTLGRGSLAACARLGVSARLVGVARAGKRDSRDEAPLPEGGRFWRFRPLWVARHLASWLRAQPTPRLLVAVSPYWVVAARRTWPDVPIAYLYPCLLTNCLPFTLPAWRSWSDWLYLQLVQRIEREALRAATRVLVPTHAAAEELTAFAPADTRKVQRVEFGCVAPRISSELRWRKRSELGIARDEFLLLLSGVMDRNKAFDFALAELPRCVPRVRLLVSGDGPLRGRLERLTVERGLSERVIFAGGHPAQDALVAACDAAISTSYYDTYPNVLLEALSAGRPIVAPRHDPPCVFAGIGEAILPGGGLLYDRAENGGPPRSMRSPPIHFSIRDTLAPLAGAASACTGAIPRARLGN